MSEKIQNRKIVVKGQHFSSLESAARHFRMSRNTLDYRLSKGWTPEQAVGVEPRPNFAGNTPGIPIKVQGLEFSNIKQAAKYYGRSYTYVFDRLKNGCTIEKALGLIKRADSLQTEYPEVAKQWHPSKNAPLTPDQATPHSGQKVWWLCSENHEWQAVINSRTRGCGCPYCARQRPTADRNLATKFPELLKEWDFEKNQDIRPEICSPRAQEKVWWKCAKGHSWQATICNRTRKWRSACPFCSNRKLCADNSVYRVRPDLAKEWHPTKNAPLTPNDVIAGGYKDVWWICKHGHEWRAPVGRRVFAKSGCSKCSLQTSRIEIAVYSEMVALFDGVAWRAKVSGYECDIYLKKYGIGIEIDGVYWHSRKPDLERKKSSVFESAGLLLFRLREKGLHHLSDRDVDFKFSDKEFAVVSRLVSSLLLHGNLSSIQRLKLQSYLAGPGLINEDLYRELISNLPAPPLDQSLAVLKPDIAKEWAYDLNAPLLPEHFRSSANKYVWWRCPIGHAWRATINNRGRQGTGCPSCPRRNNIVVTADNNFAAVFPNLACEWHPERNGNRRPEGIRSRSNKKYWWKCSKNHEWQATAGSRASGSGCPYCYGRFASHENNLASKYMELLKEWDQQKNKGLSPSNFTPHVGKKVWWICKEQHSWQATIYNRTKNRSGCPRCAQKASRKYAIEDIQEIAARRGGKCLSNEYTSSQAKLKFRCKEGHVWEIRADSVLYTNKWCPACAGDVTTSRKTN